MKMNVDINFLSESPVSQQFLDALLWILSAYMATGLRKVYFVCITVSLRHCEAYGKLSYAFPGVSDSVCVFKY